MHPRLPHPEPRFIYLASPPHPPSSTRINQPNSMGTEAIPNSKLNIFFFPYITSGHFTPMLNMATLFSHHHPLIASTVIATPSNAHLITPADHPNLSLRVLQLPPTPNGVLLPSNWDSTSSASSFSNFHLIHESLSSLRQPLLRLLEECKPHCLVSDMFLPWTAGVASEVGIPRVVFHGMSSFAMLLLDCVKKHRPHDGLEGEDPTFTVPGLPREVAMRRSQLPGPLRAGRADRFNSVMEEMDEAEGRSFGVVVNSFWELEGEYGEWYRRSKGGRVWHVGPVSLSGGDEIENTEQNTSVAPAGSLSWLDSKRAGSVLYVCFGSQAQFAEGQLDELAVGLTSSNHHFIWVVKQDSPAIGLERDIGDGKQGLIIRGWAPQVRILNHGAVGGFLTHCGWNSVLEAVSAGKPMATWPVFGDQPFNEKLVADEMGIGVRVGSGFGGEGLVKGEAIARAVERVMGGGEEAAEMRRRAEKLGEEARGAVREGGSSWKDVDRLIQDLMGVTKGLMV